MAEKETPDAKRLRKQQELEQENLDSEQMAKRTSYRFGYPKKIRDAITGESDYGTELSPIAEAARNKTKREKFPSLPFVKGSYTADDEDIMRAGREAAAEERREARGMKSGGKVSSASKRADGIAKRGKTRGKMV